MNTNQEWVSNGVQEENSIAFIIAAASLSVMKYENNLHNSFKRENKNSFLFYPRAARMISVVSFLTIECQRFLVLKQYFSDLWNYSRSYIHLNLKEKIAFRLEFEFACIAHRDTQNNLRSDGTNNRGGGVFRDFFACHPFQFNILVYTLH